MTDLTKLRLVAILVLWGVLSTMLVGLIVPAETMELPGILIAVMAAVPAVLLLVAWAVERPSSWGSAPLQGADRRAFRGKVLGLILRSVVSSAGLILYMSTGQIAWLLGLGALGVLAVLQAWPRRHRWSGRVEPQ